jgi:adenylate cyclase
MRNALFGALAPLLAIVASVVVALWNPLPLQVLRNACFDQYQRWQPRVYQDAPVRIIDLDDESLRRLGQWPWPRSRVAELLNRLHDAGPAAIAFDVVFAEPDRSAPKAMLELWQVSPGVRRQIEALADPDQAFAAALRRGKSVIGLALEREGSGSLPTLKARYVFSGEAPQPYVPAFAGAIPLLPELAAAASGIGAISFIADADGVVRRVPLLLRVGDVLVPSLAAEALRVAEGAHNYVTLAVPEQGVGLAGVRIGSLLVPSTAQGEVWIHYTPAVAGRSIPAWKVLSGEVAAGELAGRILLVGTSAQGLMDLRFSPLGGSIPGVEVHAQMLEQVLTGGGLENPSWSAAIQILVIVAGGLLVGGVALLTGAIVSLASFAAAAAALWATAWQLFSAHGVLFDAVTPSVSLAITYVAASSVRHLASERRQRWIKQAFSRYVSPNLVAYLIKRPEELELGGRRQQCSFVFTDLTGFTPMIERMDPAAAVSLLNDYLDGLIAIAFAHQGTLDRIVGDAVVIMFSAPLQQADHQRRALSCAMEMQRFCRQYAKTQAALGVAFGQTRIGIHSGEVIVGNFGGTTIFDYRALGDPVNTAARLESANKQLGTLVCVSAATLAACPDWPARPIGRVVLKGKSLPLAIFEPLDPQAAPGDDHDYRAAFTLLQSGSADALAAFAALAERRPDDPLVALHLARLRAGASDDLIVMNGK